MYAQITALHVRLGKMDEMIQVYTNALLPLVQRQTGCRFVSLLTDRSNSHILAISWWENEADLLAGQSECALQQQLAQNHSLLRASPEFTRFEVTLQMAPI